MIGKLKHDQIKIKWFYCNQQV